MKFSKDIPLSNLKVVGNNDWIEKEVLSISNPFTLQDGEYVTLYLSGGSRIDFKYSNGLMSEFSKLKYCRIQHKDVYSVENDGNKSTKIAVRGFSCPQGVESDGAMIVRVYGSKSVYGCLSDNGEINLKNEREFFWGKPSVEIGRLKDFTHPFSIPEATHFIKEAMIDGGHISKEIKKAPRGVSHQMEISKLRNELDEANDKIKHLEKENFIIDQTLKNVRYSLKCPEGANVVVFAAIVRCLSLVGVHDSEIKRRAAAIEDIIHHKSKGAYSEETMNSLIAIVVNQPFDEEVPF